MSVESKGWRENGMLFAPPRMRSTCSSTMLRRRRNMKRSRSIGAYVVRLVVAVSLPLLAFGAFLLIRSARDEQQAIATTAEERAQGAAADLDRELHNLQDLTSVLARSVFLSATDFNLPSPAEAALFRDRDLGLIVRDLTGKPLFNTCNADGRVIPVNKALGTGDGSRAYISDLMVEPTSGEPILTMDLLIWREHNPAYILSLCALPRIFQILTEQHLPDKWTAIVIDREGRTIASTSGSVDVSSAAARADATAGVHAGAKNSVGNVWDNSGSAYTASNPVDFAGWTVAIKVPNETFFGPVRRSLLILLAGSDAGAYPRHQYRSTDCGSDNAPHRHCQSAREWRTRCSATHGHQRSRPGSSCPMLDERGFEPTYRGIDTDSEGAASQ
jgi:hypothetical protein